MQQRQMQGSMYEQGGRQYALNYAQPPPQQPVVDTRYYRTRGGGPVHPMDAASNQIPNVPNQTPQVSGYSYPNQPNPQNSYVNPMNSQPQPPPVVYPTGNQNSQPMFNPMVQSAQQGYNMQNGHVDNHPAPIPNSLPRPVRGSQRTGHPHPPTQRIPPFNDASSSAALAQPDGASHKRTRVEQPDDDDNDDYDDADDDPDVTVDGHGRPAQRGPGACAACKQLKIRCVFPSPTATSCKGCIRRNRECTIPEKRPRRAPPKREELVKCIRDKDALIFQLIEQLEARSSSIGSMNLSLTSGDSPTGVKDNGAPTDPLAKEAIEKDGAQREKELLEWLKKVKATIERSNAMDFGLLGGTGNLVLPEGEDDYWEGSSETENEEYSGAESPGEVASPQETQSTQSIQNGGRRSVKRGASLVSSQSKKSGSGNSNDTKSKGSALPAKAPLGLIASMGRSLNRRRSSGKSRGSSPQVPGETSNGNFPTTQSPENDDDKDLGVANRDFFQPIERPYNVMNEEKLDLPTILSKNVIGPKEVKELFDMYFDYMNLSTCILDPKLYTPEKTLYRSPFLFTVVCAIASRFHPSRTSLYPVLMGHARLAAGSAVISGRKSLETCQAYILMSLYPIPARRWSEDRSWMYLGCAIRMATDLNLHHPPVLESGQPAVTISTIMSAEGQSREILNRVRCWLGCFNADKAMSTQFGKPTTLREDWMFPLLQRNMSEGDAEWWCPTPYGWKFDIHLCAYSALLREISNFHEQIYSDPTNPTGINENIAFEELTYEFDNRIETMAKEWFHRVDTHMDSEDPQCVFRKGLLQLEFYYNQLVALSFGFQHAFKRGAIRKDNTFLQRCYHAACRVVRIVVDELGEQKYMRYCPESHYIFATFASAFLLKLLRPKFSPLLELQQHQDILDLVERLAGTLNRIALDAQHAPKLYSRFLMGLLKKAHKILARGSNASTASSPASSAAINVGSSPAVKIRDFSSSNMGYVPELTSPSNSSTSFAQYPTGPGQGQPMQDPAAQIPFSFGGGDGSTFDMDGVQNTLPPSSSWPHSTPNPGDADTLMHMEMFNPQFWEEGLLPGFSWSDSTVAQHGDNVVREYGTVPAEFHATLSTAGAFMSSGSLQGQAYQPNPVQAFPTSNHQHQNHQYSAQPNVHWGTG